jgi:Ca2+-binding RTX toxin-like protein
VRVEPTFTVSVSQTADFERFAEGVSDAGDEFAHGVLDLVHLEQHLRDVVVQVKIGKYTYGHTEHHVDMVLMGNDVLHGGDGNDLIVGDDFVTRTATVTIVPGGLPQKNSRDDAWQDLDWKDCGLSDWFDHHHWHEHDWHAHDYHDHWHLPGLKVGADVIFGDKGDDLVWGDNLAIVSTNVIRGAGVSYKDFDYSENDAEDGIERFAVLTDSADYWLALQGHHHHGDDNDGWCLDNSDDIAGGEGNDILFGQAGNDKLRGEAGDDWLIGGDGQDSVDGGTGKNKTSSGNDNSSSLRSAVAARLMINWKDAFKGFGLPYSPFGGLNLGNGPCNNDSFDFLTLERRVTRNDD